MEEIEKTVTGFVACNINEEQSFPINQEFIENDVVAERSRKKSVSNIAPEKSANNGSTTSIIAVTGLMLLTVGGLGYHFLKDDRTLKSDKTGTNGQDFQDEALAPAVSSAPSARVLPSDTADPSAHVLPSAQVLPSDPYLSSNGHPAERLKEPEYQPKQWSKNESRVGLTEFEGWVPELGAVKAKVNFESKIGNLPSENIAVVAAMTKSWEPGYAANIVFDNNKHLMVAFQTWKNSIKTVPEENEVVVLTLDKDKKSYLVLVCGHMKAYESDPKNFKEEVSRRAGTLGWVLANEAKDCTWSYVPFATGNGTHDVKLRDEAAKCHISAMSRSCPFAKEIKIFCKQEDVENWKKLRDQMTGGPLRRPNRELFEHKVNLQTLTKRADLGFDLDPILWAQRAEFPGQDGAKEEESENLSAYERSLNPSLAARPQNFCFVNGLDVADIFFAVKSYSANTIFFVEGAANSALQIGGSGQMGSFTNGFTKSFGSPAKDKFNKISGKLKVKGKPLNILGYEGKGSNCFPYLTQGPHFSSQGAVMSQKERELLESTLHAVSHVVERKKESSLPIVHFRAKLCGAIFKPSNPDLNSRVEKALVGSCIREAIANPKVLVCLVCEEKDYLDLKSKNHFKTLYTNPNQWSPIFATNAAELKKFAGLLSDKIATLQGPPPPSPSTASEEPTSKKADAGETQ